VRASLPPGRVLGVIVDRPLHRPQLAQIAYAARTIAGHVLLLVPVAYVEADRLEQMALHKRVKAWVRRLRYPEVPQQLGKPPPVLSKVDGVG